MRAFLFTASAYLLLLYGATILYAAGPVAVPSDDKAAPAIQSSGACASDRMVFSTAYSPYSVHVIRSEVSGRIVRINAREGQVLKAGVPVMEIDARALKEEAGEMESVLASLEKSEKILSRDMELLNKKYSRYLALRKKGHVEEQAVENMERELHGAELLLIDNRRQQAEMRRNIIDIRDRIRKCAPSFSRDLYVAENFKEIFETVVPGDRLSRLLDISRAKTHIVLSPACFASIKQELSSGRPLSFDLVTGNGRVFSCRGRVEKLKLDPDNSYLYSYGFDLVFAPLPDLLWGQVVKVRLSADAIAGTSSRGTAVTVH